MPISGTVWHMIVIFGAHVQNDDISKHFFHFYEILIFGVVSEVKGQKMVQNCKKFCLVTCHISGTIHHMNVIFAKHV